MRRSLRAAGLLVAALAMLGVTTPGRAAIPLMVAVNRCNGQTIGESSARVRDYDRHPPAGNQAALLKRYALLSEVINTLNEEREILDSVCASDAHQAGYFADIAATSALALVLEADVTARLNAACAAAAAAFPSMILADAWLTLAGIVNEQSGTVPTSFNDVIPKVQSRALSLSLALPTWADTSAYWRDQVRAKAKEAIATCPTPSPSPGPT
jgi:hypothetical protein